ncbi:bifunctional indole-3-glycerol-phosphate synthase TrpC/phosphoribosylanthranilate isomerase TrpF [Oceanisphaera arctica]|uniref:Multifunctional fusion protein n=1 Tax=Oceanisphaera arctica TaxID=641510 RepID=A0A2P5TJM5_9GAMM|nr:bifunctional indole-3-glycerol-phosphate synthase TrpC/phosphoribosylanthranilate isomerase TrpF [Oceanisphaera arctica]PPL15232.1 bifunctional indole-3-glycerol phosphate synthase/phosphoribosylanthranilate isomerase [Oceanisphaera arctica]GHA28038.1 bifunctional indole-3-glycerol phosphate synthase/phosphoribosylanthranilate isomerase [Oceanisphaera arctica]
MLSTVLGKIVADKKIWVAERKQTQPLSSFEADLVPSDRPFVAALSAGKPAFILECKKASPSKGLIREHFDLDAIAAVYGRHASAISVLTDEKYFQGKFEFVTRVRDQVSQPVICKDFIIDPYQIKLARHHKADAILLMLSVLNDDEYRELNAVAQSLNMGVLTEVISEEEVERAIALNARVIGINNRDLRDLSIDLDRTRVLSALIPDDRIVISESGIYQHTQVKALSAHADGFLVGSSLMAEDDLELAVRRLTLGDNKVCGLTRPQDAAAAHLAGAVFGGLIFVAKSPRCVDIEQARIVMAAAPLLYVGVFQNHAVNEVASTALELGLTAVQLHGAEDDAYISELKQFLPTVAVWKAVPVSDSLPALPQGADRLLFDTKVGSQSGGTGQAFNWQLLNDINKAGAMLAGGLTPNNAADAAALGCIGLDLNSGVESAPGQKDAAKLNAAFASLRHYGRRITTL